MQLYIIQSTCFVTLCLVTIITTTDRLCLPSGGVPGYGTYLLGEMVRSEGKDDSDDGRRDW